jgi:hypothetical protein
MRNGNGKKGWFTFKLNYSVRILIFQLAKNFAFFLLCFAIMSLPLRVFEFAIRDKFCSLRIQPDNFVDPFVGEYLQNSATGNRQIVLPGDMANLHWCNDRWVD